MLQPDPLYESFLCIESGGLAVDVPNGTYRVFVNLDNPSGFWGEYQAYKERRSSPRACRWSRTRWTWTASRKSISASGTPRTCRTRILSINIRRPIFKEKTFDVNVTDGQLRLDFQGSDYACSVSAVIIFPVEKAEEGARFLQYTQDRRRFYFDNYFKRVLHQPTGDPLPMDPKGYVPVSRGTTRRTFTTTIRPSSPSLANRSRRMRLRVSRSLRPWGWRR